MNPDDRLIDPESALGKALVKADLWYPGDKQDGFIKGWNAHAKAIDDELVAQRRQLVNVGP